MEIFRFSPGPNKAHLIKWRSWSKEAFEEANKENKPVFLSLAATWCHWCHVMDKTTFSHLPSISFLNEHFIPVRVDTDRRPDIQNRYIMDGWPTNAFLTDEGDIITGNTYIPPAEFRRLLKKVSADWLKNREEIISLAAERRTRVLEKIEKEKDVGARHASPLLIGKILDQYTKVFDEKFGGFGEALKFPAPLAMELFMREAQVGARHASPRAKNISPLLKMATVTLDNMAKGEIYDKEWGGFFRYSTERDWSRTHSEKMLAENAGIIMNYLHAYEITGKPLYKEVAVNCLDYINTFLANHPMGGFFGSQNADEEFYRPKTEDRKLEEAPFIDKTVYTDSCAQMISTYLEASRILNERKYLDFAVDSMRFLLQNCLSSYGTAHYYTSKGETGATCLLQDQVWLLMALIDLYEHDPEPDYLTQANDIVDIIINRLAGDGAFFDKPAGPDDVGNLKIRYEPVKENAVLALALWRLSILSNSKDLSDMARQILSAFSFEQFKGDYISMAPYALALSEITGEEIKKAA